MPLTDVSEVHVTPKHGTGGKICRRMVQDFISNTGNSISQIEYHTRQIMHMTSYDLQPPLPVIHVKSKTHDWVPSHMLLCMLMPFLEGTTPQTVVIDYDACWESRTLQQ